MSKFVNLEQIKVLANKVKSEDAALGTKLETVTTKVDNLVAGRRRGQHPRRRQGQRRCPGYLRQDG